MVSALDMAEVAGVKGGGERLGTLHSMRIYRYHRLSHLRHTIEVEISICRAHYISGRVILMLCRSKLAVVGDWRVDLHRVTKLVVLCQLQVNQCAGKLRKSRLVGQWDDKNNLGKMWVDLHFFCIQKYCIWESNHIALWMHDFAIQSNIFTMINHIIWAVESNKRHSPE